MRFHALHGFTSRATFNISAALVAVSLSACNPGVFFDLMETPIAAINATQKYRGSDFGLTIAGYDGASSGGPLVSRVVATGSPGSSLAAYDVWEDGGIADFDALWDTCDDPGDCGASQGTSLVGFARWNAQTVCAMGAAPDEARLRVICESESAVAVRIDVPGGESIGTSLAPIPFSKVGLGVAFAGAPDMGDSGLIHVVPEGAGPQPLDLSSAMLPPGAGLGRALASAELPSGMLIAATAQNRVVVAEVALDRSTTVLGCIDGTADLFGRVLALGDLDGDGSHELAMTRATNDVVIYRVSDLSGASGCAASDSSDDAAVAVTLACAGSDRVDCAGFGEDITAADLDADGNDDLIVGAPNSTVDGVREQGAALVFHGAGADMSRVHHVFTTYGDEFDRFGAALAHVRTQLETTPRDELVIGAPGAQRVFVALCTGLEGDRTDDTNRCVVRE